MTACQTARHWSESDPRMLLQPPRRHVDPHAQLHRGKWVRIEDLEDLPLDGEDIPLPRSGVVSRCLGLDLVKMPPCRLPCLVAGGVSIQDAGIAKWRLHPTESLDAVSCRRRPCRRRPGKAGRWLCGDFKRRQRRIDHKIIPVNRTLYSPGSAKRETGRLIVSRSPASREKSSPPEIATGRPLLLTSTRSCSR